MSTIPQSGNPSSKSLVIHLVEQLPDDVSLEAISEQVAILAALQRGEQAADAGRLVPHEEVQRRMESWLSK